MILAVLVIITLTKEPQDKYYFSLFKLFIFKNFTTLYVRLLYKKIN